MYFEGNKFWPNMFFRLRRSNPTQYLMNKISAFCDSLCEPNPGEMHVGCWAKNENDEVLFSKHKRIGHGTCNEAEYYALFTIIEMLAEKLGDTWPTVIIHSDSQLMTKQVNRIWQTTKPEMVALFNRANKLQEKYGFTVKWIPRENNAVADALAQEQRLKGSGRRYTMEDGRFRVYKNTPCVEIFSDREMQKLLFNKTMQAAKERMEAELEHSVPSFTRLVTVIEELQMASIKVRQALPTSNSLVQDWINSTFTLLDGYLEEFLILTKEEDSLVLESMKEFLKCLQDDSQDEHWNESEESNNELEELESYR